MRETEDRAIKKTYMVFQVVRPRDILLVPMYPRFILWQYI